MSNTTTVSFNDNGSRSNVMVDIISTLLPFVTVVVGLRIWTRAKIVRSIGLDDWVIGLALVRPILG